MARSRQRRGSRVATAGLALLLLAGCGSDNAQEAGGNGQSAKGEADAAPYAGKTVQFVVPYDPGGGFDTNARLVAPYLAKCLDATVVVSNEPGAGSMRATTVTAAADPGSNRIQIVNTVGLVAAQIAGAEGAKNFDLADFTWIGRISAPPSVLIVNPKGTLKSFDDVVDASAPVRVVSSGPGAGDYINSKLLQAAYGFPMDLISGFSSSPEARTAVVAGDADAFLSPVDTQLSAIRDGDVDPLISVARERDPLVPDVPTVFEAPPTTDEGKQILGSLVDLLETGRAVVAPPGLDEEHAHALQEGLACALKNDEVAKQSESQNLPLNPLGGEETGKLVTALLASNDAFKAVVRSSF